MDREQEKILEQVEQIGLVVAFLNVSDKEDIPSAQIYALKLWVSSLFNFLSVFCNTECSYDSQRVNAVYLRHCLVIEKLLDDPQFFELKEMYQRPFETLLKGGADDPDYHFEWDLSWGSQMALLVSKVDEMFIRNGSMTFELDESFKSFLKVTAEVILEYKQKTKEGFAQIVMQMEGRFGKQKEENDDSQSQSEGKYYAKDRDIELDKHIWLHQEENKCYLLLNKKGNGFEKRVSIRPQTFKIIRAVYGIRHKDPFGLKLIEFCHPRNIAANDQTISTRIKELKQICEKHGITQILTKFPGDRWGLNRKLGCCQ